MCLYAMSPSQVPLEQYWSHEEQLERLMVKALIGRNLPKINWIHLIQWSNLGHEIFHMQIATPTAEHELHPGTQGAGH